jgi:chromosome partitioning protein
LAKIFAIANQKGGVGKTTTAVNLAASLAATRKRVLLIDLDPQGNATTGSGVDKHDLALTVCDVLLNKTPVTDVIVRVEISGFDVLPGNADLTAAEVGLLNEIGREKRLSSALKPVIDNYDFILIDCPPSLSMLTINGLSAAHGVIIPMQCEYFALEGMTDLLGTIEGIREMVNPALEIEGVLRTMYDPRNSLTNDVSAQLTSHFQDKLFRTCIPRNVRLAEAPSFGLPALIHDKTSRGALAYLALAGEMLRRLEGEDAPEPQPESAAS